MKIAVIDVETTGLNPVVNRITEIGIVFLEDGKITGTFESLVNPQAPIPPKIKQLTGIDSKMVKNEPVFADLAEQLHELTHDHVIAGHHVNFDYSFLKSEMKLAGISFSRKTICTADLSRYLISNLNSYSLSTLCRYFSITNRRPHRALPDAEVTAEILLKLIQDKEEGFINSLVHSTKKSNLVPEHLKETIYKQLPQKPGVYYFIGRGGKPVYIGKAANLRSRVLSHFRGEGNSLKILALGGKIHHIKYQETGNELVASLLEDHEIRHYWPVLNSAQKKTNVRFGIVNYLDQLGRRRLNIAKSGKAHCFIASFHQYHLAVEFVKEKIEGYGLNGKLCGTGEESDVETSVHNRNFDKMLRDMERHTAIEVYFGKGRRDDESSFIWIENDGYKGFGFIDDKIKNNREELLSRLTNRFTSVTSEGIIKKLKETQEPSIHFKIKNPARRGSNLQS